MIGFLFSESTLIGFHCRHCFRFFLFLKWCSSTIRNQWIYQSGLLRRPQSDAKRCECLKKTPEFQLQTLYWCSIFFCLFLEIEMKSFVIAVLWWCGNRPAVKCISCLAKVWSGFILEWNKAIYLSITVELSLFAIFNWNNGYWLVSVIGLSYLIICSVLSNIGHASTMADCSCGFFGQLVLLLQWITLHLIYVIQSYSTTTTLILLC